jgi:pyrroline-5-carboxylate reductase
MTSSDKITIIGGGNIGTAILKGLVLSGEVSNEQFTLTRRHTDALKVYVDQGVKITNNNVEAIKDADVIILTILAGQVKGVLEEIAGAIPKKAILVSVATGSTIAQIKEIIGNYNPVILVMPNTAIAICESMTCLSSDDIDQDALKKVQTYFDLCGKTMIIPETLMPGATILAACGVAFFMRYIRAASQGGIQVGFHAEEAQIIAAQTARGASKLMLFTGNHPEREIDKVTTPMGCTIAGLNEMEHNGLSSALIKGIIKSYNELVKP